MKRFERAAAAQEQQRRRRPVFSLLTSPSVILLFVLAAGFAVGVLHSNYKVLEAGKRVQQIQQEAEEKAAHAKEQKLAAEKKRQEEDVCARPDAGGQTSLELWGSVATTPLQPDGHFTAYSAEECCRTCKDAKGCNTWVWCNDITKCGGSCWLKRQGNPDHPEVHAQGGHISWTSGIFKKDYDVDPASLPPPNPSIKIVRLETQFGAIRIKLEPSWSGDSVSYVRQLAAFPDLCTTACEFYRAEPGFLLQGSLRAYIPPNTVTKQGVKVMERGDIGWAGGTGGPDWFIYLGSQPATHFGTSHTVWGRVADDESMQVAEKIVKQPATAPQPGSMHMLDEHVPYSVKSETGQAVGI